MMKGDVADIRHRSKFFVHIFIFTKFKNAVSEFLRIFKVRQKDE